MPTVTSKDGTTISYEMSGAGPALILVDGAMCYRDSGPARDVAKALQESFTVYIYDRRGRGDSSNTLPYAVSKEVDDIAALLEAAGGSAFIYGCSSGGMLGIEAANALPGIRKLIVYEAPLIVDDTKAPLTEADHMRMKQLIASGQRSDAVKMFMRFVGVPRLMLALMPLLMGKVWKKLTTIAHTLPYDFEIMGPYQRGKPLPAGQWEDIKVPVLVADGGKSPPWIRHGIAALAKNLGAEYRTLDGQTHMVKANAQAPMIRAFLLEA